MQGGERVAEGADARARRQERADRLRRRVAGGDRRRRRARHELPLRHRAIVQLDESRLSARRDPRRGAARRSCAGRGRSAVGHADRSARRRSGCLSSQAQFDKTMSYIRLGRTRARGWSTAASAPPIRARERAFSSSRPCSPMSRTTCGSRARNLRPGREHPALVDEDDLVARVNALDYGLTASIWTHDLDRAHRLASRVEAGYSGSTTRAPTTSACRLAATSSREWAARSRSRSCSRVRQIKNVA